MINEVLKDAEVRLKKTAEALRHSLVSIRTGRATPALVEHMQVEAYGDMLPLNQMASITTPDPRMNRTRTETGTAPGETPPPAPG